MPGLAVSGRRIGEVLGSMRLHEPYTPRLEHPILLRQVNAIRPAPPNTGHGHGPHEAEGSRTCRMARGTFPPGYLYVSRERAYERRTCPLGKSDTRRTKGLHGARGAVGSCMARIPPIRAASPRARRACVRGAKEAKVK